MSRVPAVRLVVVCTAAALLLLGTVDGTKLPSEQYEYECFPPQTYVNSLPRFASRNQNDSIALQVSKRFTHQIFSRIYSIFLREVLNYRNVKLVEINDSYTYPVERFRLFQALHNLVATGNDWIEPTIDLEMWILSDLHIIPPEIVDTGPVTLPGRYGLFIPKALIKKEDAFPKVLPYTIFQEDANDHRYYDFIKKFEVTDTVLSWIKRYAENDCDVCNDFGMYVPEQCEEGRKCALVLAPHYKDTNFIVKHIAEMDFRLKVVWLGGKLNVVIKRLLGQYASEHKGNRKFLVLHWTPSEVIDSKTVQYQPVTMPRCEEMFASNDTGCKYELTPLLKFHARIFGDSEHALQSLTRIFFSRTETDAIFELYDKYEERIMAARDDSNLEFDEQAVKRLYDQIACEWMQANEQTWDNWRPRGEKKEDIAIGGIFPMTGLGKQWNGIEPAATLAKVAINENATILPNHLLKVLQSDGQCRADTVMKNFINYFVKQEKMIGILGPACSETVEPIAGVSKHFRMVVISYSAEGASLSDREMYPYFFRTIGENRQYEHVYTRLLKQLNWHRVAALTEDGQKATEYIVHMEPLLKENQIEFISNKKFPRDRNELEMNRYLEDLKTKNAKIIIADVDDKMAQVIMCEAYKLEMTAENGYVWFLPAWLSNVWNLSMEQGQDTISTNGVEHCTTSEMLRAMNGHFSLSHAPFADDSSRLDVDGSTVLEWKQKYAKTLQIRDLMPSDYAGYAYDAVWVYALALDKLIKEDPSYLTDLHSAKTTKRLLEVIRATDFQGVSGRIRFTESGSRYTIINVLQFTNGTRNIVGRFTPNISETDYEIVGGTLVLNESAIVWMTRDGTIPDDGTLVCTFAGLAKFFDVDCDGAMKIIMPIFGFIFIVCISVASFFFWKVRYDQKMKSSARYLQKLGIDLLSPSSLPISTLDKWEVPKDRVVINRRLGEGAFGTVYGGEAQIGEDGWTAVAVKTLKVGSTTEDKVDFLSEAESMKRFDHNNIVRLLGVCLQSEPVYTIMEFMLYGDLKTYLLARRHLVNSKQAEDSDISNKRLTMMALDVARALSYLAEQKYVHRDVACRNCMVNAQRVVKLGDFGMARPTFENDYYRFNRRGMLPVRWMAPESLGLGLFTTASDVWSYGVLLYEIITFGSFPFQGLTNNQVLEHLKKGNILVIPTGVKPQLTGLMKACWNQDYKKRPSASEITEFISNYPRLLNPCLDVPLASVEMTETDSDQFELLPSRKRKEEPMADLLAGTCPMNDINNGYNDMNLGNHSRAINLNDLNVATDFTSTNPTNAESLHHNPVLLNVYNPIEPLLQRDNEISKSNNSLRRYVPMFGFGKNKTPPVIITGQNGYISTGPTNTSIL